MKSEYVIKLNPNDIDHKELKEQNEVKKKLLTLLNDFNHACRQLVHAVLLNFG